MDASGDLSGVGVERGVAQVAAPIRPKESEGLRLTENPPEPFPAMGLLELKQQVSRLSQRERVELQVYMICLLYTSPSPRD